MLVNGFKISHRCGTQDGLVELANACPSCTRRIFLSELKRCRLCQCFCCSCCCRNGLCSPCYIFVDWRSTIVYTCRASNDGQNSEKFSVCRPDGRRNRRALEGAFAERLFSRIGECSDSAVGTGSSPVALAVGTGSSPVAPTMLNSVQINTMSQ